MTATKDEEGASYLLEALSRVQEANRESFEILEQFSRGGVKDPALDISHVLKAHLKSLRAAEKVLKVLAEGALAQGLGSLN